MSDPPNFNNWTCPLPLRDYPNIVLGHGSGGKLSSELIEHLFLPALGNPALASLRDSAVVEATAGRLAFTTDSFVVRPLFFPGGCIGDLAVYGTVNDLAMSGAKPLCLSAAFILEEGLPTATLGKIVEALANAARAVGVPIVTGDTKVVERGHGDGCYINTSGIGVVADGVNFAPDKSQPGDRVLVSGSMGDHGIAVLSVREGLEFESLITSDTAPLNELVQALIAARVEIRVLRDPTRGGLASSLNEIATASRVGILLDEATIPIHDAVRSACELLGLDPLFVANEGKLVAIVAPGHADKALEVLRGHPLGREAAVVGNVTANNQGLVAARTAIGGTRVVPMLTGEQLPRIC
jgi:hydrogenase expression/formation protein HypE